MYLSSELKKENNRTFYIRLFTARPLRNVDLTGEFSGPFEEDAGNIFKAGNIISQGSKSDRSF
jgi:hypothetical protein